MYAREPDNPQSEPACDLLSRHLPARLRLDGLSAAEMEAVLDSRADPELWLRAASRGALRLSLLEPTDLSRPADDAMPAFQVSVDDGTVEFSPDRCARITPRAHQGSTPLLVPQSFYLALAHQLARAGVMPVHGAALRATVSDKAHGILALGPQFSGKSTLTFRALLAGADVISDDWVLVGREPNEGTFIAERMRRFLMLRDDPTGRMLVARLTESSSRTDQSAELRSYAAATGGKQVIPIPEGDPRFPESMEIDTIWVLTPPATKRPHATEVAPCDKSTAFAALVEATMPLLMGPRFRHERVRLLDVCADLVNHHRCWQVLPGTDITRSTDAWEALVRATSE